ncbi:MAG TPA: cation transporter [Acidobacteriota bacterium]|nr:cation transporter [Acidobacteriota bacterium]
MTELVLERSALVRRGLALTWATLAYNGVEAVLALVAAAIAGSVALVGFGADSTIELSAAAVALWRLHADADPLRRAQAERVSLRLIGGSFLVLAAYVTFEALLMLSSGRAPDASLLGIAVAAGSVLVMPVLARAKRKVALAMSSSALHLEANQTMLCTYLSAILLGGLLLNALFGWWWADPLAALVMAPIIVREGWDAFRGRNCPCCPR